VLLALIVLTRLLTTLEEKSVLSFPLAPWTKLLPTSIRLDTMTLAVLKIQGRCDILGVTAQGLLNWVKAQQGVCGGDAKRTLHLLFCQARLCARLDQG